MSKRFWSTAFTFSAIACAQSDGRSLQTLLKDEVISNDIRVFQLREYIVQRIAPAPIVKDQASWTAESAELRKKLLEIVYHGWPAEWVNAPPRFEETGVISGKGYRIRKLRYEIVPGFFSTALLYEPENVTSSTPAILNVNGHVGQPGKAVEYKQKRCINFARNGIIALNLEWLNCGELTNRENTHWFAGHLDLTGHNGVGLFYLAMRRGLDYLHAMPSVDRNRIGMTGLSGGGWQTILLSALDERIRVTVPVAGFSSVATRVEVNDYGDVGDPEQSPSDVFQARDYTHLLAMVAPRPALLAYNAEDDCCFRASAVKPLLFDPIRAVYETYRHPDFLQWHENVDPGTHNYQLDNRRAAYSFFAKHFRMKPFEEDEAVAGEVRSYEELVVGLPKDNLTMLGLARKFAQENEATPRKPATRDRLTEIVQYRPATLDRAWLVGITKNKGVESKAYAYRLKDGLSATGIRVKAIAAADSAPITLVLNDGGRVQSGGRCCRTHQPWGAGGCPGVVIHGRTVAKDELLGLRTDALRNRGTPAGAGGSPAHRDCSLRGRAGAPSRFRRERHSHANDRLDRCGSGTISVLERRGSEWRTKFAAAGRPAGRILAGARPLLPGSIEGFRSATPGRTRQAGPSEARNQPVD